MSNSFCAPPSTIVIGDSSPSPLKVRRLGYGTMRLTGADIWGEPADRSMAKKVLIRALEMGVNFLDTANYYGPYVTNQLIVETLYPYPTDLVICTKVGAKRGDDKSWIPYATPRELRLSVEDNLKHLKLEQLPLVHFRVMPHDHGTPFAASLDAMFAMQKEGKILHVGLSNVTPDQLKEAMRMGSVATVQNLFGYHQRQTLKGPHGETKGGAEVLRLCETHHIPLTPFFSLVTSLTVEDDRIASLASRYGITPAQLHIAWLLHYSPWILPIPGTSSLVHLEENLQSASIPLSAEDMTFLG